jgi:excisionase family DNA binding protein
LWYGTVVPEISVAEAAKRLDIGEQRVRALAASGALPARRLGNAWALDSSAVDARLKGARRGRPLSARSAWAVLLLLEGRGGELQLHRSERSRAAARARTARELEPGEFAARAQTRWRFAHPAAYERVTNDPRVVLGGEAAAVQHRADLVGGGLVELYVREEDVSDLERDFALRPVEPSEANVKLHIPAALWPFRQGERIAPRAFVAADLIDDGDARSVRAGRALLARAGRDPK